MALSNEALSEAFNSAGNKYGPWSDAEWAVGLQALARAVAADCARVASVSFEASSLQAAIAAGEIATAIRLSYGVTE